MKKEKKSERIREKAHQNEKEKFREKEKK